MSRRRELLAFGVALGALVTAFLAESLLGGKVLSPADVLLRSGAAHVVAADVGYGQLAWSLRTDPRVTVLDRVNVRTLENVTPGQARRATRRRFVSARRRTHRGERCHERLQRSRTVVGLRDDIANRRIFRFEHRFRVDDAALFELRIGDR